MVDTECAPPGRRRLPRRPVLLGLLGAATAVPAAGLLSGCGQSEPDPLEALAVRARSDAELIDRLRARPGPAVAQLAQAADARRAHATALAVELGEPDTPAQPSAAPAQGSSGGATLAGVLTALDDAHRQASALVATLPRSRAALVGSIAACCAAYRAVLT